jgi:HD-like signal output (HDOD) protein
MSQALNKESCIRQTDAISKEDLAILNRIEELTLKDLQLGFDPKALEILDNENSSSQQINDVKQLISKDIVALLFRVGSSFHYQKLRLGVAPDFYELIMRLGTVPAKIFILAMSLFAISSDEKMKELSARCFATSLLSRLFAQERKWKDILVNEAELMGLFLEIGKVIMLLYQHKIEETHPEEERLDVSFVDKYHSYFGEKIVEKFKLPSFLGDILSHPYYLSFDDDSLTVPGLVFSTWCEVDRCFRVNRKLIIQSVMPNQEGNPPVTPGAIIQDRFLALGLGKYLDLRPVYFACK